MRKRVNHAISGVFVFLLLGIFAVFGTVMVVMGAKVYRSMTDLSGVHNVSRITSAYLRSMVRGDDEASVLTVEAQGDGNDMIVLRNVYDDEAYITRIYVSDGMLREWFAEEAADFEPENGEEICAAEAMEAELEHHLLRLRVLSQGTWQEVEIAVRSGEVAE